MRKRLKKYGHANIIRFSPEDMINYNLKTGDIIEFTQIVKIQDGKKEHKQREEKEE